MIQKVKWILIALAIIFVTGSVVLNNVQRNTINKMEIEALRLENNNFQLMQDNTQIMTLNVRERELSNSLRKQRDSIAKALQIKPKQIETIIYQTITQKDTVIVNVPVLTLEKNHWLIADTGKCYIWKGEAVLSLENLSVKKTEFSYHNKTTEVYFKTRPHKFLFLKFGKWQYKKEISSECGEPRQETINFVK